MSVKLITKEKINDVISFGKKFHEEAKGYNGIPFDEEKLRFVSHNDWYTNPNWLLLAAFDEEDKPYGMFVGYVAEYYFSRDLYATDLIFFIEKSKRGGFAAIKFIKIFERWAKDKGVKEIRPATTSGIDINRTKDFYKAMKYEISGHNFRKEIL